MAATPELGGVVNPNDLIATARELAGVMGGPLPRQTNLRRAVSTTYYALFHCLAENCADMLIGPGGTDRRESAWQQAYRALQHGTLRARCDNGPMMRTFPIEIQRLGDQIIYMQPKRERADYDPSEAPEQAVVILDIEETEQCITQFRQAPERDRRAFAVYVLLNLRNA